MDGPWFRVFLSTRTQALQDERFQAILDSISTTINDDTQYTAGSLNMRTQVRTGIPACACVAGVCLCVCALEDIVHRAQISAR